MEYPVTAQAPQCCGARRIVCINETENSTLFSPFPVCAAHGPFALTPPQLMGVFANRGEGAFITVKLSPAEKVLFTFLPPVLPFLTFPTVGLTLFITVNFEFLPFCASRTTHNREFYLSLCSLWAWPVVAVLQAKPAVYTQPRVKTRVF